MKALVFDAGPIISLTTNNLLGLLVPLKQAFHGVFYISSCVRKELIERPLQTKKFKFEALQVEAQIEAGVLSRIDHEQIAESANELYQLANKIFWAKERPLNILQMGEIESIAGCIALNASAVVVDERITRMLLEEPEHLKKLLQKRLNTKIHLDNAVLDTFEKRTRHISIIRSTELALVAYEKGFLNQFVVNIPQAKKTLLESVLWGLKLNGCAISEEEIGQLLAKIRA